MGQTFSQTAYKIYLYCWYFSYGATTIAALYGGFFIACTNRCKRRYLSLAALDATLLLTGMAAVAPVPKLNTW